MNKNKFIQYVGFIGLLGLITIVVVFLLGTRFKSLQTAKKNFPAKIADVLPTLPIPSANSGTVSTAAQIVFVPRVVDGDTIIVEPVDPATGVPGKQETVRYIGMDTPETVSPTKPVECYGHEASTRNKELVAGKYVAIVKGESDKDKYGRLLRFVYLLNATDTFVNLELVKEGYARVLTIPPNTEFADEFDVAVSAAQSAKLGFWGACAKYPFQ